MKLVSRFEAASRSTAELYGLLHESFRTVAAAPCGTQARSVALASVRNIQAELALRAPGL